MSVDADQADSLLHLLDAVVIKLEGGTEEDLQILNVKLFKPMTKDVLKEKEDHKRKSSTEKKSENRYFMILDILKKIYEIWRNNVLILLNDINYSINFIFSEENKLDDSQHDEKDLKDDQNANMEVENIITDENVVSDSNKIKENEDEESKNVEETADNDKPRM